MAERPVFMANYCGKPCFTRMTEFTFSNGFAVSQKRKSVASLHDSIHRLYPERNVLEVSSCSTQEIGMKLSAFNLPIKMSSGMVTSVECAFQGSKVFGDKGPFTDLLTAGDSRIAKSDDRIRSSGPITGFEFDGRNYSNEPRTFFYDYLYFTALAQNPDIADELMKYDTFTDIFFNPQRSENCQAAACARYVSLRTAGLLNQAMNDPEFFKSTYDPGYRIAGFSPADKQTEQNKEKTEEFHYKVGDHIIHDIFGDGEVTGIKGKASVLLEIHFKEAVKILSEQWVIEHCRKAE